MKIWSHGILALLCVCVLMIAACGGSAPEPDSEPVAQAPVEEPAEAPVEEPAEEPAEEAPAPVASGDGPSVDGQGWDSWYQDCAIWVGSNSEFVKETASDSGMLRANTNYSDNRIRDMYLARKVEGLTPGETYTFSVDFKFDGDPEKNYIQYKVEDGDHESKRRISRMEDYPDRPRPETQYVDKSLIGSGEMGTITYEHTVGEGETEATFMMIVRFQSENRSQNWFTFGNFNVQ